MYGLLTGAAVFRNIVMLLSRMINWWSILAYAMFCQILDLFLIHSYKSYLTMQKKNPSAEIDTYQP